MYILYLKGLVNSMVATVQKWGNSLGVRIPRVILDTVKIAENDKVEIINDADTITIRKVASPPHKSLEDRLVAFYGKPVEAIASLESDGEYDWGTARGAEEW